MTGLGIVPSRDVRSGININRLTGRYEWHVDSNPLTGILFVTGHKPAEGGQLEFSWDGGSLSVEPRPGRFVAFDARAVPHRVTPVAGSADRISVVMNFYLGQESQERPSDLDEYLYGGSLKKRGSGHHDDEGSR